MSKKNKKKGGGGGGDKNSGARRKKKKLAAGGGKKPPSIMHRIRKALGCAPQQFAEVTGTAKQAAQALGFLPKDVSKLKLHFDDIDIDGVGEIDYDEFLEDVDEPRSPFTDAVFALVDVNGNGMLLSLIHI